MPRQAGTNQMPADVLEAAIDNASGTGKPPSEGAGNDAAQMSDEQAWEKVKSEFGDKPADGDEFAALAEDGDDAPKAQPAKSEPEAAAEETPEIDLEALNSAKRALRRDQVPADLIDEMAKSNPAKLIEWAESASSRQKNVDGYTNEMAELRAKLDKLTSSGGGQQPPSVDDLGIDFEALAKPVADSLDPTVGGHFRDALKQVATSLAAQTQKREKQRDQQVAFLSQNLEEIMLSSARSGLKDRFPQLDKDSVWKSVKTKATQLARAGGYESVRDLVDEAAKIVLYDHTGLSQRLRIEEDRKAKAGSTPTPPPQRGDPAASPMSSDEWEKATFMLASKGLSEAQIMKQIGHRAPRGAKR